MEDFQFCEHDKKAKEQGSGIIHHVLSLRTVADSKNAVSQSFMSAKHAAGHIWNAPICAGEIECVS